jgi:hypothetical protein
VAAVLWFIKANGETGALDYREKAPLAARKICFLIKRKCN